MQPATPPLAARHRRSTLARFDEIPNGQRLAWIGGAVVLTLVLLAVVPPLGAVLLFVLIGVGVWWHGQRGQRSATAQNEHLAQAFEGPDAPAVSERYTPPSWSHAPKLFEKAATPTGDAIALDADEERLWIVRPTAAGTFDRRAYGGADLLDVELREHTETVNHATSRVIKDDAITKKSTSGIIGRGLVGKAVAGDLGGAAAAMGAKTRTRGGHETVNATSSSKVMVSSLRLQVRLRDPRNPLAVVEFLQRPVEQGAREYHEARVNAERWFALVELLMGRTGAMSKETPGE